MRATKKRTFRPSVEMLETRDLPSNYFVAMTGSDSNNGTSAPWLTIQHAADTVKPGDTVTIEAGTYAGFDVQTSGTPSASIIFQAATGATVVIDSTEKNRGDCAINIEDFNNGSAINYITIEGLRIDNSVGSGGILDGIRAVSNGKINSTGISLIGNTINDCAQFGILTSHEDNLFIEGNTVSNTQIYKGESGTGHGIYVSNACFDPQVIGNTIFGNQSLGLHMNGDQSEGPAQEPDGTSDGNLGNIIGAVVEDNVIYNNGVNGINCDGVQDSLFENNLLYNNGGGIVLYVIDAAAGATNNVVVNNTISVALTDIMGGTGRWDIQISDGRPNDGTTGPFVGSTGNIVFNNILINQNSNHGSISIGTLSLTGFASNDNIITTSGDGGSTANHAFDLTNSSGSTDDFVTLANWQSMTGQDKSSATATSAQLFVNPGVNFHLLATGPAVDKGVASFQSKAAPTVDLDGNPRPAGSAYDIGAYEFQPALLTSTTTITAPATVVAGQSASFQVTVTGMGATPTGTVSFYDGASIIASGPLNGAGQAVFQTSALTLGTHSLSAVYNGNATYGSSTATPVSVTVVAFSISDNFNRANAPNLGSSWTVVTNPFTNAAPDTFAISSNQVSTAPLGNKQGIAVATGFNSADATASVDLSLAANTPNFNGGGVVIRQDNNDRAYAGVIEQSGSGPFAAIGLYNAGTFTILPGSSSFALLAPASVYTVKLSALGTQLTLFVNGVLVASASDATLTQAGDVGLLDLGGVSTFDNFAVSQGLSLTDTFQRVGTLPQGNLGPAWSEDVGGFSINASNQAVSSVLSMASLVGINTGTEDVQATIASLGTSGAGVLVQWNAGTHSGYEVLLTATGVQVNKVVNGVASSLFSYSQAISGSNTLEAQASGSSMNVYLNGNFLFAYTDFSSTFTSGTAGLASNGSGAAFSKFSAAVL